MYIEGKHRYFVNNKGKDTDDLKDDFGLVDLTHIDIYSGLKEKMGNDHRDKMWFKYNGTDYLLKSTIALEDTIGNYCSYGEIIMEEACKLLHMPAAHYELVKYNDKNGELKEGVISESFVGDKSKITTLFDVSVDKIDLYDNSDITDYNIVIDCLYNYLKEDKNNDLSEEKIDEIILNFKKQLMDDIVFCAVDNHSQNYGLITEDNKIKNIAPSYDREAILMLDMDIDTLLDIADNEDLFYDMINSQCSRILPLDKIDDYPENEPWKPMMAVLLEDERLCDYYYNEILSLDMEQIFENIKKRKIYLDDDLKRISKLAFESRIKQINKEFLPKIEKNITSYNEREA